MPARETITHRMLDRIILMCLLVATTFLAKWRIDAGSRSRSEIAKARRNEIRLRLSDFYYPVVLRLKKDEYVWNEVLSRDAWRGKRNLEPNLERALILDNYDEILSIIDNHLEMIGSDSELRAQIDQYERHVAMYKALRASGQPPMPRDEDDIGWPKGFLPLMQQRAQELQAKLDSSGTP